MVIYIELFLIVNVLISVITIIIIHETLLIKYSKFIMVGQIINIIYLFLFIYDSALSYYFKLSIPSIIIFLSFKTNLYTYLKAFIMYYLLSVLLGGGGILINITGNIKYLILLFVYLLFLIIFHIFFNKQSIEIFHNVKFSFINKTYNIKMFLDTGCSIFYKGVPVIILNKKFHFNIAPIDQIYINSGISEEKADVFYINKLIINKREINVYCIFLDICYDGIIGYDVL